MENQMASIMEPIENDIERRQPSNFFQSPQIKRAGKVKEVKKLALL